MKSFLTVLVFSLLTNLVHSSTLERTYQNEVEALNQEIQQELLYGDLTTKSVKQSLNAKIKNLSSLALKIGGRKHRRMVVMSFKKTLSALAGLNNSYRMAMEMTYANGLTGREIITQALDPENNRRIMDIYNHKKDFLRSAYSGKKLLTRAMDLTLEELDKEKDFAFLKIEPAANYVMADSTFNFLKEKCVPRFGEESFHILVFGFNRCFSKKYKIDRWTVGPGFFNANKSYSYMTGLKIGKKNLRAIGVRAQVGIKYGGGIGVFIGNGLVLALDIDEGYGIYGGVTYFNLRLK